MNPFANSLTLLVIAVLVTLPLQFPTSGPSWLAPVALAVAAATLGLRFATNRFKLETPVDIPLLIIIALMPLNLWASPDFGASMTRAYSFLGSIFVFWAVAAQREQPKLLKASVWLFLLAGLAIAFVIVLWTPFTFSGVRAIQVQLIESIPTAGRTPWGTRLNTNLSAGVVVLFWAPAFTVLLFGRNLLQRLIALPLVFVIPLELIFAQSRGALIGIFAALAVITAVLLRQRPLVLGALMVLALVIFFVGDIQEVIQPTESAAAANAASSLEGRIELWSRAQYMLQDFPFTGVGPGQVEPTVRILYPLFRIAPDVEFSHFHNLFLQIGGEHGIPSLIAHGAFYLILLFMLLRHTLNKRRTHYAITLGLLGSLVTFLTHNLVDAIPFFPRAAFIIWGIFGYMMAIALAEPSTEPAFTETVS